MENIIISVCLSSVLAGFAIYKKELTKFGVIVAWGLTVIITYCGGIGCFAILLSTFLATIIAGKILHKKRDNIVENISQKSGKRDSIQVLANVGFGTLSLVIYFFTKDNVYLITYACVMASSLADSMASEIGVLSKGQPVDITTFKPTTRGISGGVTILGLLSSLLGSTIIALIFYFMIDLNLKTLLFIITLGLIGSIIDSILGSLVQVKYKCTKCSELTEKLNHCNEKTNYVRGIKIINNDVVNFLNNISVFIISIVFLKLMLNM